ncbi:unnamed protein product [Brassica oleracea]
MPLRLCLPSNDSVLHLLLCERLCISSFDSLYYATPDLFFFSICRRQWWLSLLDLLCSEMSIAYETAEGLFVGFDGAGEGVNSEEEEARGRAEREAAEREVARVRMRQE